MLHLDLVPLGILTHLLLVVLTLTLTHLNLQHQLDLVHHFSHYVMPQTPKGPKHEKDISKYL